MTGEFEILIANQVHLSEKPLQGDNLNIYVVTSFLALFLLLLVLNYQCSQ